MPTRRCLVTRAELEAAAEVFKLLDDVLSGLVTNGNTGSIERLVMARSSVFDLGVSLELATGYGSDLAGYPLEKLRSEVDRLRSRLAGLPTVPQERSASGG